MPSTFPYILILALLAFIPALILSGLSLDTTANTILRTALNRTTIAFKSTSKAAELTSSTSNISSIQKDLAESAVMGRTPVYFIGHGGVSTNATSATLRTRTGPPHQGPNVMQDTHHPAYAKLAEIGREITQKVKPKAVVVISGHWEGSRDTIEVNTAETIPIIYDFYGFPAHPYKMKYPHTGSTQLAEKVLFKLREAGLKAKESIEDSIMESGHLSFQVSLFKNEDPDMHYNMGKAISSLRDEGVQIIVSGMAVHSLRDLSKVYGNPGALSYTYSFDEALKEAVEQPPALRQKAMAELLKRKDARQAHTRFEHLLPLYVGAGAASEEKGKRLWTLPQGSMSWAQFRFGEVGA